MPVRLNDANGRRSAAERPLADTMMRITLCSILWVVGACVGSVVAEEPSAGASHDRVKVELYMETLCPYCARFIRQTVNKAFESGMGPIMDLELIPWVRFSCLSTAEQTSRPTARVPLQSARGASRDIRLGCWRIPASRKWRVARYALRQLARKPTQRKLLRRGSSTGQGAMRRASRANAARRYRSVRLCVCEDSRVASCCPSAVCPTAPGVSPALQG